MSIIRKEGNIFRITPLNNKTIGIILNLSHINRKAVAKTLVSCFFCLFCSRLNAQQVYLYHFNSGKSCIDIDTYYLYYDINNKIVVRPANGDLRDLNFITIKSDSARIEKLNDSLYHFQPIYKDVRFKIYIINNLTDKKIDSVYSNSISLPLSFSINKNNYPPSYSRIIIENMKFLFLEPMRKGCLIYERGFKISYYELALLRNDTVVLIQSFKGGEVINNAFKRKLKQLSKPGDGLFAKDVILKNKNGQQITIDEYGLLKIH